MVALTTKQFITKAKAYHGTRYTYAKTSYINNKTKVRIRCRKHGLFYQRAAEHIAGHGCYKCTDTFSTSIAENEWLDSKRISKAHRQKRLVVKGRTFTVDAYIPRSKTVYEFYGDIWHGNPDVYKATEVNPINGEMYGVLYAGTMAREAFLRKAGYKVVNMWEKEWEDEQ